MDDRSIVILYNLLIECKMRLLGPPFFRYVMNRRERITEGPTKPKNEQMKASKTYGGVAGGSPRINTQLLSSNGGKKRHKGPTLLRGGRYNLAACGYVHTLSSSTREKIGRGFMIRGVVHFIKCQRLQGMLVSSVVLHVWYN